MFWPEDDQYYSGTMAQIVDSGQHVKSYEDVDSEILSMANETRRPMSTRIWNNTAFLQLDFTAQTVLHEMMEMLGNKQRNMLKAFRSMRLPMIRL